MMAIFVWGLAIGFLGAGTWLALRHFRDVGDWNLELAREGISVLKPLCGLDEGLEGNLESFFLLDYPEFELVFSVASADDSSLPPLNRLLLKYPRVRARVVVGAERAGENPKVNNLVRSYARAHFDLVVISDSNVRVPSDYLRNLVGEMRQGTGVVTAVVAGTSARGIGGHLEAMFLNTFYARGMSLAFAAGQPCVIGKSMMFRKCVAEKFGGVSGLADYLAEDYALGEEMRKMGLGVVLMRRVVHQHIGSHSLRDFWLRHIRWGRIRKAHAPFAFLLEPAVTPMAAALAGAAAFDSLGVFAGTIAAWMACDLLQCQRMGASPTLYSPVVWLLRELLAIPLWVSAAMGSSVNWRGKRLVVLPGGKIQVEASLAAARGPSPIAVTE